MKLSFFSGYNIDITSIALSSNTNLVFNVVLTIRITCAEWLVLSSVEVSRSIFYLVEEKNLGTCLPDRQVALATVLFYDD